MSEPVIHDGVWWQQRPDGTWLRWDTAAMQWVETEHVSTQAKVASENLPASQGQAGVQDEVASFEPLTTLARWVMGLLIVVMTVDVVVITTHLNSLGPRAGGIGLFVGPIVGGSGSTAIIGGLQLLATTALIPPFLIWFRRAYENLPSFGARGLRFTPGWAIGSWFIPILNYFRPAQIAADIWKASHPTLSPGDPSGWRTRRASILVPVWFVLWVFSLVFGQTPFQAGVFFFTTGTPGRALVVAGTAARIGAAMCALAYVALVTKREHDKALEVEASAVGQSQARA